MEIDLEKQIETIKQKLETEVVFNHPDLDVVCLGGSNSSNSAGRLSDIDITTVMKPKNPKMLDANSILQPSLQLRKFAFDQSQENLIVVVISTIRLEEAQIAMAEILNPGKTIIPIHWLHYPSVEFAAINEPPKLMAGLLAGRELKGSAKNALDRFKSVDQSDFKCLAGLDWLTDSLRVLIANINNGEFSIQRQPDSFLKKLALHNLEYFWKWNIIRKAIEGSTGQSPDNWRSMEQFSHVIPDDIWKNATCVRLLRHKGEWADITDIIDMHVKTFNLLSSNI